MICTIHHPQVPLVGARKGWHSSLVDYHNFGVAEAHYKLVALASRACSVQYTRQTELPFGHANTALVTNVVHPGMQLCSRNDAAHSGSADASSDLDKADSLCYNLYAAPPSPPKATTAPI